jgi:ubiquinone/menaquinone biosynthesis C-methylase UbiE
LLDDKDAALEKICRMLRPGGVFVSSTACITDMMPLFRLIAPIGVFFHLFPPVAAFSVKELTRALTVAGLEIEHEWSSGKNKAIFIVARKSR